MPNAVVKKYAKETGKSPEHIEKWWKEAEEQALKKFPKKGPHYWAYVNGIVERRGKLVHGKRKGRKKTNESFVFENLKMTFKQFISEARDPLPTDDEDVNDMLQSFIDDAIDQELHDDARDKGSPEDSAEFLLGKLEEWLNQRGYSAKEIDDWMEDHADDAHDFLYQGLT
ncbi:hypothetical protein [Acinetobacter sp.]|uniref:hypothetical protein n=1 Tax=Acinetobacter sp. TaxID=472 RepID=UPI00388DDC79